MSASKTASSTTITNNGENAAGQSRMEDTPKPYSVVTREEKYRVCAPSGREIMTCNDEHSASHYAVLLNKAYADGYRHGRRERRDG